MRAFNTLYPRSKVWLEDEQGNLVFGSGRLRILQAVRDTGSLYAAARELKMSYRAVWARIHATEERLGEKLLERQIGGSSGGGSRLTPLAEALMAHFSEVQKSVEAHTDALFANHLKGRINIREP